jgi:hypothetical protein
MKFGSTPTVRRCSMEEEHRQAKRRNQSFAVCAALFTAWMLVPEAAWAQWGGGISFPVLDTLFCQFISYSKSKLAPYIAVLVIIIGVIGHWLGATKVWGALLYVAIGLGVIMGIGSVIANATGAGASCLA